ncbi:30S ribosomal protein S2 [candidate division TA06 bacterium DG_26]|uniref:Small ribosomal subunit protein uS2 n=1 Tax=candidate division TA06 bacterium DG_26 TaxID=1703771 RepID=A0A0S7WMN2_UNCT6|nr:MAG: 30S ribosomal protein S2 [candidate division TA06 bacterium DG_26]
MAIVSMKDLLESGVHFGHRKRRWNPRMKNYIFAERNGIHIIDLEQTLELLKEAYLAVRTKIEEGGSILFVGTKKQIRDIIEEEAKRCNAHWVTERWLGGTLTNYRTIKRSIEKYRKLLDMEKKGEIERLIKKEGLKLIKERERMGKLLEGIREMDEMPSVLYVVDVKKEETAVLEARKVGIPVVGLVDTNGNPDYVDYPVPGNDDAIRSVKLITGFIATAVLEGRMTQSGEKGDDRKTEGTEE